ncbi:MAG: hypothetical protein Q8R48_06235, partial [Candidatus Omnitrophota bacterium]|nr:hypothetical protein [Candidatus Omnitrophota bacterium]
NSGEYKLLADYLKGQDDPYVQEQQSTFRRRDSLALMFTLLKQIGVAASYWDLLNFLFYGISKNNKKLKIPENLNSTADLWKYYMQHEYFSVALLALFVSAQHALDDRGLNRLEVGKTLWDRCVINCDANNLNDGLKKCLVKLKKNPTLAEFLEYLNTLHDVDKAWDTSAISEYSICEFVYGKQFPADILLVGVLNRGQTPISVDTLPTT